MKDLGKIIRSGLPAARTRCDVIELCKWTLFDLESRAFGTKLFIRYMQPLHIDTCGGPIDGLSLSGIGPPEHKIAVGVAFIDPADVHLTNGMRGLYAGGAVCHPTDPWSKDLGKTIAVLRSQFISADTATNMAIRMSPWDRPVAIPEKVLRTQPLKYPWAALLEDENAFPSLAHPAIVDAIRYSIRYCLGDVESFAVTATNGQSPVTRAPPLPLVTELIDKACTLPTRVPLTADERAEKEKAGRAVAAMAAAPTPPPEVPVGG